MTLWTFVEAHITNFERKHYALLKIAVDMHSQFSPIWQIFLPVYHQPSKRASCFISNLENLASTKVHRANFTSEMLGTFFWCQHRLAIAVFCKRQYLLQSTVALKSVKKSWEKLGNLTSYLIFKHTTLTIFLKLCDHFWNCLEHCVYLHISR